MKIHFYLSILPFFIYSCANKDPQEHKVISKQSDSSEIYIHEIELLSKFTGDNSFYNSNIKVNDSLFDFHVKNTLQKLKNDSIRMVAFEKITNEPSFFDTVTLQESYRLFLFGTFESDAYLIRVEHFNNLIAVTKKKIKLADDFDPMHKDTLFVVDSTYRVLSESEWLPLSEIINHSNFWHASTKLIDVGLDGSWITLEGVKNLGNGSTFQHNTITQWSPDQNYFRAVSNYMMDLANLDLKTVY